jgi:translation initiation factor IF-2
MSLRPSRSTPTRSCVGCGARDAQQAMVRLRRGADGVVRPSPQAGTGRSAYVHPADSCVAGLARSKGLGRSLRMTATKEVRLELMRALGEALAGGNADWKPFGGNVEARPSCAGRGASAARTTHGSRNRMAESRSGTEKKSSVRGAATAAKAAKAAPPPPPPAPSVVIRRVRRRPEEESGSVQTAPSALGIGNRRVSTMVDVSPETLALFDAGPFSYASEPALFASESVASSTDAESAAAAMPAPVAEAAPAATPETSPETEAEAAGEPAAPKPVEPAPVEVAPAPVEAPAPAIARPVAAEEEEFSDKVSADEAQRITDAYSEALAQEEAAAAAPVVAEADAVPEVAVKRAGPRVLGRIDLTRKAVPAKPAAAAPATAAATDKPKEGESEAEKGRKKKRKVVRKEDLFDALERAHQVRPRKKKASPGQKLRKTELTVPKASKRVVRVNDTTTAAELARSMGVKVGEVLGTLMRLGAMKTVNDLLDYDTATLVAEEFGYTLENTALNVDELLDIADDETDAGEGDPRPPVVTVMGHVDHGKTSLLDAIRRTNVVSGESGGITQHIGAYMVDSKIGPICFLDTPGHAAFTAMRSRGAGITDVVVLVVAADDGVMPQTIEAINHAKAAEVPVIVAVNKIDKPDANPDRVKQQLTEYGLQPEEWGGQTQYIEVSALKRTGIDELLEAISLQAEILDLRAPADARGVGTVIESRLDRGRGPVATVLVQKGVLKHGDHFVCGEIVGRVRAMSDHAGQPIKEAGPSTPVEIIGLDGVPSAGDSFVSVEDPSKAAQVAEHRREATRKSSMTSTTRMSLEDLQRRMSGAVDNLELGIVIKADVDGSVEAIKAALEKLSNDEVTLRVIHGGVGAINESDVQLAMASNAIVVGFHVRPEGKARQLAEREGIDLRLHTVIYELIDEVKAALEGLLAPEQKEVYEGRAEVRNTFSIPSGTIAGCYVLDGTITRSHQCRVVRDGRVVYSGRVSSLRRFKDDAREVQAGYECGVGVERFNDVKVGDVIECFRVDEVKRKLSSAKTEGAPPAGGRARPGAIALRLQCHDALDDPFAAGLAAGPGLAFAGPGSRQPAPLRPGRGRGAWQRGSARARAGPDPADGARSRRDGSCRRHCGCGNRGRRCGPALIGASRVQRCQVQRLCGLLRRARPARR